jgi:uncharacterized membrane protein YagU involved in acid resistance
MEMRAMATTTSSETAGLATTRLAPGVVGGLAGGVVFGMMMQMMDMIPMVAMLVGSESAAVGWLVHLAISAVIGAGFTLVLSRFTSTPVVGVLAGAGYGMVWWVLGPLLLMPAKLGMPLFAFNATTWQSLMGHVIFGMILGGVAVALTRRMARPA